MLGNSLLIATLTVALTLALVLDGGLHLRPSAILRRPVSAQLHPARPAVSRGDRDPAAVHQDPRSRAARIRYWGIVLPQVAFSLGMAILLLRNAFRQLPGELLDAAMMDGCGYISYFFYITLPLSGPILATVAMISFVGSWNNYLLPLVVLNSERRYPWTLGLMAYQGQYSTSWQLVLAFITLTILPAIVMFLLAQKYIVAGLTAGAVKG